MVLLIMSLVLTEWAEAQQDTAAVDSALLKQIEHTLQKSSGQGASQNTQPRSGISTNPNMSVIGDFRTDYRSRAARNFNAYLMKANSLFNRSWILMRARIFFSPWPKIL
jgi:hypothetical protein